MLHPEPTVGDTSWFVQDRFGLFIHWGLYALPSRHEWLRNKEEMTIADYERYFKHFDPDLYDPSLWAKTAANAGMKYFVATTKHHDGFCLWDSKYTKYKSTNTPYGKDLLRPMVEAFAEQGLRTGFYHSLIDWHHPDFVIDDVHPLRNHPNRAKLNAKRDQSKYAAYLHNQIRELLTDYGNVDILWTDFSYPSKKGKKNESFWGKKPGESFVGKGQKDWQSKKLYKMIRELRSSIILNDRLDLKGDSVWDIKTPEQFQPDEWLKVDGKPVVWEACQTFSGSWGYYRDETSWKTTHDLLVMLVDTVSKGGNLLLNVGPTGRGDIDARAMDCLNGMGRWMKHHSRSIYGCTQAPKEFVAPSNCSLTYNHEKKRLYIHLLEWPFKQLALKNAVGRVEYAQLLNDASEMTMKKDDWISGQPGGISDKNTLLLNIPPLKPNVEIPVIELFLK